MGIFLHYVFIRKQIFLMIREQENTSCVPSSFSIILHVYVANWLENLS